MKNWSDCSLTQHRFPIRFVSSVCLLVRVTVVDKNKAVACCLLATSSTMSSEKKKRKRKMWSKKWYLKRNISCDAHLLNELLETVVPWGDAIVVSAGKLKNCGIPWVNCTVLCVKDDWKGQFWGLRYCLSKLCSLLSFTSGMTSHSKIAQFNWQCIGALYIINTHEHKASDSRPICTMDYDIKTSSSPWPG